MMRHKSYAYGDWQDHVWDHRESEYLEDPEVEDVVSLACARAEQVATRQEDYQWFLDSNYWERVRGSVIARANGRCQGCGSESSHLEVHHKQYPKRGTEHLNLHMLEALCRSCHTSSH